MYSIIVQFRKISIPTPWGLWRRRLSKAKILKKSMKLDWNFQNGVGFKLKIFPQKGMDICWNYAIYTNMGGN